MAKRITILLFLCIVILAGCGNQEKNKPISPTETQKMEVRNDINLNITTTDKLLYNMVKSITKDRHSVEYMFKDRNTEVNFQYTQDSLNNIAKGDLFFYIGAGFEPWANDFMDKLDKSKVGVINVSRGVKLLSYNKVVKYKDSILRDNPYYLLNIDNYKIALMNIKNAIQDKDPKSRDVYEKNFADTLKNIEGYQKDLKGITDQLTDYTFIASEDELSYFIKYTGLKTLDITIDPNTKKFQQSGNGSSADLNTKLGSIKKLVLLYNDDAILKANDDIIKKNNIKVINIKIYNGDLKYEDILKYNIEDLKKILT